MSVCIRGVTVCGRINVMRVTEGAATRQGSGGESAGERGTKK